jgi:hypothetical protein
VSCSCTNTLLLTKLPSERFLKKLAGKADIEDALKRLDKLTIEEAQMATAQVLKATHTIDDRVKGVDNRVASEMVGVNDRVIGVGKRVKAVDDKVTGVVDGAQPSLGQPPRKYLTLMLLVTQQTANDVDQMKRVSSTSSVRIQAPHIILGNQLRESLRRWLSPPDPSTNHNAAGAAHHEGSAKWFFQGSMFSDWKSTGSLLWIHGNRTHLSCS